MKKIMLLLLLCAFNICKAQNNSPELPIENCSEGVSILQEFIQNYQNAQAIDNRPFSYVINTSDIINYFNIINDINDCYFHVYFGIDQNKIVRLIIVPTTDEQNSQSQNILEHDPNYKYAFVPCLYEVSSQETNPQPPQFCYVPDQLDAIPNPPSPCFNIDIINSTTATLPVPSCTMLKQNFKQWIINYQTLYPNDNNAAVWIQSFTFNANLLRSFLTQSGNTVPLLQIYIARDPNLNQNTKLENYTLIFIGLDNFGNHIPVTNAIGSSAMAYEACMPCPRCGIDLDPDIDNQQQATNSILNLYKSYKMNSKLTIKKAPKFRKQRGSKIKKIARMQRRHRRKMKKQIIKMYK